MNLSEVLQDASGGLSAMRLAMLMWTLGVLIAWAGMSVLHRQLENIPDGVLAVLGILTTGKTVQRFGENPTAANVTSVATADPSSSAPTPTSMPRLPATPPPAPAPARLVAQ